MKYEVGILNDEESLLNLSEVYRDENRSGNRRKSASGHEVELVKVLLPR